MNSISKNNCVEKEILDKALADYMLHIQCIDEEELFLVFSDFSDPYDCYWIEQEYLGDENIDGKEYEVLACWTELNMCNPFFTDEIRFKFYMLVHLEDPEDKTVGAYRNAEKLYIINPIDPEDFPEE